MPTREEKRAARRERWRARFAPEVTTRQKWSDVIFGIVLPILALIFDPIVFRDTIGLGGTIGLLAPYNVFGYLGIGLGILVLAIWLWYGDGPFSGYAAGVLFAGALFALALGVVLLPYSVLGLFVIIGVLGFTPFFTAFAFLRNGVRAIRKALDYADRTSVNIMVVVGFVAVLALPGVAQWQATLYVSESLDLILENDDPRAIDAGIDQLQRAFWCAQSCYQPIVEEYSSAGDERQQVLADAYRELTGEDIFIALPMFFD